MPASAACSVIIKGGCDKTSFAHYFTGVRKKNEQRKTIEMDFCEEIKHLIRRIHI